MWAKLTESSSKVTKNNKHVKKLVKSKNAEITEKGL
jgi:hypothetical protein